MIKALIGLLFGSMLGRLLSFICTIILGYVIFMYFFNPRGLQQNWNSIKSYISKEEDKKEITVPDVNTNGITKEIKSFF